jgi:hypothetical protein
LPAALHFSQSLWHRAVQHTPSAQCPLSQSDAARHAAPSSPGIGVGALAPPLPAAAAPAAAPALAVLPL